MLKSLLQGKPLGHPLHPILVHLPIGLFLRVGLEGSGFDVTVAKDGEDAISLFERGRSDVIVLDVMMPGMDGSATFCHLQANPVTRHIPVVLLTAQSRDEHVEAGFAAGVTDYLTKPFYPAYVRSRVREWLLRKGVETPEKM